MIWGSQEFPIKGIIPSHMDFLWSGTEWSTEPPNTPPWPFGRVWVIEEWVIFLGSVLLQQKFEATDVKPLGASQLLDSVLQLP